MREVCIALVVSLSGACGTTTAPPPRPEHTAPAVATEPRDLGTSPPAVADASPEPEPTAIPGLAQSRAVSAVDTKTLHWLAAASGSVPDMNQVQIEQDIALAASVFGEQGRVLFGAGRHAPVVQVLNPRAPDPKQRLMLMLGEFFSPRAGRDAAYRKPAVGTDEPATADTVLATLRDALAEPGDPLLLYIAGHGDMGQTPRDNRVMLWGPSQITVAALGDVLDDAQRPVHLVATTCFSGGFGELAFHQADASRGAARTERCGLFAAPWDLEATGCDPNPNRASQQGYGLHFLNALRGRDRDGNATPMAELDLDGDGAVSLLEAHTRVRTHSDAGDVPTTTSERWLREVAPERGPMRAVPLPEEDAVVRVLSDRLGMRGTEVQAHAMLQALDREIEARQQLLNAASQREDAAYHRAAASLLAKWPLLDDPWHPDFAATLQAQAAAIEAHLGESEAYAHYLEIRVVTDAAQQAVWEKRVEAAPVERLVRALDNRSLAARLQARGGPAWARYQTLLECERSAAPGLEP